MGDNSLSKREGRKIYLDISVFNDNASVNMLDYISVIIDSIPVNDIKLNMDNSRLILLSLPVYTIISQYLIIFRPYCPDTHLTWVYCS